MDSLPYLCRFQYSETAEYLTTLTDPLIAAYQGFGGSAAGQARGFGWGGVDRCGGAHNVGWCTGCPMCAPRLGPPCWYPPHTHIRLASTLPPPQHPRCLPTTLPQDLKQLELLEGQLTWLVHIIGAVVRGRMNTTGEAWLAGWGWGHYTGVCWRG